MSQPIVSIVRIATQARSEKTNCSRFSADKEQRDPSREHGEMGGAFENVDYAGKGVPGTQGEIEHLTEKQEVLATLTEENMLKELEEQKTREALELIQRKHKLLKWEGERERARMLQRMELSGAVRHCSGAFHNSSFGSSSPSLALETDEAMSVSSKMAQDADDAMPESSRTALAKGKERDWWSIDLEGEMEKLEVVGHLPRTEGGSVDPFPSNPHAYFVCVAPCTL